MSVELRYDNRDSIGRPLGPYLDEVIVKGGYVHLEMMDYDAAAMVIHESDDYETCVWIRARGPRWLEFLRDQLERWFNYDAPWLRLTLFDEEWTKDD